jgi:hypothetical protein
MNEDAAERLAKADEIRFGGTGGIADALRLAALGDPRGPAWLAERAAHEAAGGHRPNTWLARQSLLRAAEMIDHDATRRRGSTDDGGT